MSIYFMEHGKPEVRKYTKHGRTKQSFKDQCDINKILERAATVEGLSHLEQFGGQYADFSDYDFQDNMNRIAAGQQVFEALPAEIKREFDQDPGKFFAYANDPANADRLPQLLPQIAKRGNFFPAVGRIQGAAHSGAEGAPAPKTVPPKGTTVDSGSQATTEGQTSPDTLPAEPSSQ